MVKRFDCNGAHGMQEDKVGEFIRANEYPLDIVGWICSVCRNWNDVNTDFCSHSDAKVTDA